MGRIRLTEADLPMLREALKVSRLTLTLEPVASNQLLRLVRQYDIYLIALSAWLVIPLPLWIPTIREVGAMASPKTVKSQESTRRRLRVSLTSDFTPSAVRPATPGRAIVMIVDKRWVFTPPPGEPRPGGSNSSHQLAAFLASHPAADVQAARTVSNSSALWNRPLGSSARRRTNLSRSVGMSGRWRDGGTTGSWTWALITSSRGLALERGPARQQGVGHAPQRVQVATPVDRSVAGDLLGGHVLRRATDGPPGGSGRTSCGAATASTRPKSSTLTKSYRRAAPGGEDD